ncbi:hypothetical protein [Komagataeibacter xylinus]|uniref:Uncharacterized protein n=1 Tax=Komagataeibacter xylinus TaxID=28448 RepID=A0A857FMB7_KOMXY|nr:hypothetical protein [Komagataeibacter xylinus]QHC35371.1 hypothetical protein FMA36_07525 [Komagataeibacter xylinus]
MKLAHFISLLLSVQAMNDLSAWRFLVIAMLVFAWICSKPAVAYLQALNRRQVHRRKAVPAKRKAAVK